MEASTLLIHMTAGDLEQVIDSRVKAAVSNVIPLKPLTQKEAIEPPVLFSEICVFLQISQRTGRTWVADGKLPRHFFEGKQYFYKSEVSALIKDDSNKSKTSDQIAAEARAKQLQP